MNIIIDPKDSPELRAVIYERYLAALKAFQVNPKSIPAHKLDVAMTDLARSLASLLTPKDKLNSEIDFLNYANKAKRNFAWLSSYGVSKERFVKMLIDNARLLTQTKPETLRTNFEGSLAFLAEFAKEGQVINALLSIPELYGVPTETQIKYFQGGLDLLSGRGVTREAWGLAMVREPRLLHKPPLDMLTRFEDIETVLMNYGISQERCITAILRWPEILSYKPEHINNNIVEMGRALEEFGINEMKWCACAIQSPDLFTRPAQTTSSNIIAMLDWMMPNGLSAQECIAEIFKQPSNLHGDPRKLKNTYELIRVLTQVPALALKRDGAQRIGKNIGKPLPPKALERFACLTLSEDNLLLRAAIAELLPENQNLSKVMSMSRGKAEGFFVKMLGFDANEKLVDISNHNQALQNGPLLTAKLQNDLHAHADELRSAWRKNAKLTEDKRKPIKTNVLGVIAPFANPAALTERDRSVILTRAVMGGLLKGYKLAPQS